jgi:hypothetical protein
MTTTTIQQLLVFGGFNRKNQPRPFNLYAKILGLLFVMSIYGAAAQPAFLSDLNGRPMFENTVTDVEGSPYLNDDWTNGIIKAKRNLKNYEVAKLRYDAHKEELEYDQAGKPYRFNSSEIAEFSLPVGTFRAGFPAVGSLTPQNFYQVLYDGEKVKLLKRISVVIETEKPYNSATIIKRYTKQEALFLLKNNVEMVRFKKDKKSLLEALSEKQAEVENLIKTQKLKLTKEEDLMTLLEKYESMP